MKHDLNFVDPLVLKLGPKVEPYKPLLGSEWTAIHAYVDRFNFQHFDCGYGITEAECRQIKPKAQYLIVPSIAATFITRLEMGLALGVAKEKAKAQLLQWMRRGGG